MTTKLFEIRDVGTTMVALAIKLDGPRTEAEQWCLARAGFGTGAAEQARYVLLLDLADGAGEWTCDPYRWTKRARTLPIAQRFIQDYFDVLESGAVVDVQVIIGETTEPKRSDRLHVR